MLRGRASRIRRALRVGAVAGLTACGAEATEPGEGSDHDAAPAVSEAAEAPPDAAVPPVFPDSVRSLRLTRSITVRLEPREDSPKLGTVARDIHVGYQGAVGAPGCEGRWIEIEPRGFVCEVYLEPSEREPHGVELPKLAPGELVPGRYGRIVGDDARLVLAEDGAVVGEEPLRAKMTVRRYGEAVLDGIRHWRIGNGRYVAASSVRPQEPSRWRGVRLQDETGLDLPIAFALSGGRPGDWVPVYGDAAATERLRRVAPRTLVVPQETLRGADGEPLAVRIGEDEWVRADDLRMVEKVAPPPTTRPGERWIDLDLDRQTLVAYEGDLPVFATLVSSGTRKNETETGIYRVWIKFAETDMSGRMGESDAYSVATVPWTQFYAVDLALHTSYWHDRFGEKRSHGCVNLSPRDARFLYFWTQPDLPPGWSMANGLEEYPGSMVRVRSAADPSPEFRGYAARVAERRRGEDTTALVTD